MNDTETLVRELVQKTPHMSLGTVSDGRPWVCEVHFGFSRDLELFFVSRKTTRHCQEIARNPRVAGNIVKQHDLDESPRGLYFEGVALEITPDDEGLDSYCMNLGRDRKDLEEKLSGTHGGYAMYKITVDTWSVFGDFDGGGNAKHALNWSKKS